MGRFQRECLKDSIFEIGGVPYMTRPDYRLLNKREREYKAHAEQAKHRCAQLVADSTGAVIIAEQDKLIESLEAQLAKKSCALDKEKLKSATFVAKYREIKNLSTTQRKKISALQFDVEVAHLCWRELERNLKKTEDSMFSWIRRARKAETELSVVRAEVRHLKARLNRTPENSSIPPSADANHKKVHNSRVKTDRSPGAQPGHTGHKRKTRTPDEVVLIKPFEACPECGGSLVVSTPTHRSVTDLVISAKTIDYVASSSTCTQCGKYHLAPFPACALNETNYGNGIRAVSTYLVNRCNISKENAARFLHVATGGKLKLSSGSIHNFLASFSDKAKGEIDDIIASLKRSSVMGSDATFTRSEGARSYIYTYNTPTEVIFQASNHKGNLPLTTSPVAGYKGTIIHDHDRAYFNFGTKHAECNVHVLRYLKGICENESEKTWAKAMRSLFCIANDAAKTAREEGLLSLSSEDIAAFEARYDAILELAEREYEAQLQLPARYRPEGIALFTRLKQYRNCHLAFMHDLRIPFDNNASERLLRKAKGKLKQSGGFRSTERGEAYYCDFLSISETAVLRGKEPLEVIRAIFDGETKIFKNKGAPHADP
jgi:predicted secreted protein